MATLVRKAFFHYYDMMLTIWLYSIIGAFREQDMARGEDLKVEELKT
jgi:hypothetical protein